MKHLPDVVDPATGSKAEAQRGQRVIGMARRHREGDAQPISIPLKEAIDEAPLGRNLRRSELSPVLQQCSEHHG